MAMIERLDHLVLTVADIARTVAFYERVLGMHHETFGRWAARWYSVSRNSTCSSKGTSSNSKPSI
jgi:predicted enzyme related to lactoylglutathione lyase